MKLENHSDSNPKAIQDRKIINFAKNMLKEFLWQNQNKTKNPT